MDHNGNKGIILFCNTWYWCVCQGDILYANKITIDLINVYLCDAHLFSLINTIYMNTL